MCGSYALGRMSCSTMKGREVSSACNICHPLLTTRLCFYLSHHFGQFSSTVKELWWFFFSSSLSLASWGAGRVRVSVCFPFLVHFFVLYHLKIQRAIGWAGTPWLDASGGRRHRFRATGKDRAQFPGRNLGGFAKP